MPCALASDVTAKSRPDRVSTVHGCVLITCAGSPFALGDTLFDVINPYAAYLGRREPLDVIQQTPAELDRITAALGPDGLKEPLKPGGWTAGQIVAHLADTEIAFGFRLRQCLSEPHHVIQPFDQDRWQALMPDRDTREALQAFRALRVGTLGLAQALSPDLLSRPVTHPERGVMTVADVVATIAGHDLNHLRQLDAIAARRGSVRQPS